MRAISTAVALSIYASNAIAQSWDCTMTSECLDQETCAATKYDFNLSALGDQFLYSDIAGERPMSEVAAMATSLQRAFVSKVQDTSVGLVSLFPDGRALYTLHSPDFSARYSGTCEAHS